MGGAGNVDLGLARADRLDQDGVEPGKVEQLDHSGRRSGQPAQTAARRHAAHKDAAVAGMIEHPHPVAQECATAERAAGIHGNDRHTPLLCPQRLGQLVDQAALAGTGRASNAHNMRPARLAIDGANNRLGGRRVVFNLRHQAGDGPGIALPGQGNEIGIGLA